MTKPTKWLCAQRRLRSAWASVCSESSLCAQWIAKDPSFLHADSEDWHLTGRMPNLSLRWAHIPFCLFCHEAAHISLASQYCGRLRLNRHSKHAFKCLWEHTEQTVLFSVLESGPVMWCRIVIRFSIIWDKMVLTKVPAVLQSLSQMKTSTTISARSTFCSDVS